LLHFASSAEIWGVPRGLIERGRVSWPEIEGMRYIQGLEEGH